MTKIFNPYVNPIIFNPMNPNYYSLCNSISEVYFSFFLFFVHLWYITISIKPTEPIIATTKVTAIPKVPEYTKVMAIIIIEMINNKKGLLSSFIFVEFN
jgi:hypothetical protein